MKNKTRGKNILVTGGAGFLGAHLCRRLLRQGRRVICLDNLITGSKANIRDLVKYKEFTFIKQDVSREFSVRDKLDWVIHFASLASPVHYLKHPLCTLRAGLQGTYNCLLLARQKKAGFFLASTSEVYGDPHVHPQSEEYWGNVNSIGERSCYDESKRGAEAFTYAFHRQFKTDIRVVRIFNTYGPGMQLDDGRVVSNFIVQALKHRPLTVYGNGTQTRSFCYVADLIEGVVRLLDVEYHLPVNLGNPAEFTINELAQKVSLLTGSKARTTFKPLPADDPKQRRPDITRARQILSWEPQTSLDEGLQKTIPYFQARLKR